MEGPQSCADPTHLPYSMGKGTGPKKVSDVLQAKRQVTTSLGVLQPRFVFSERMISESRLIVSCLQ